MDTVSIIEAALVAGAAASAKDTASQAVKDAYTGLKTLLIRLFADKPHAQVILEEHETDPEIFEKPLKKLLIEAHADQDADLLAAAEQVMTLVQPQQVGMGKYTIQNTGTVQGQNIGDNQQITQYFGIPPKTNAASSSSQLEQRDRDVLQVNGKNKLELKAQRKQICLPILYSIHELAPVMAEFRKAHDDLWARQKLFFQAGSYVKRINRLFETARERAARAGSELSIDPDGQKVMDAFVAYLKAQDDYVQAIIKPMSKFPTWFFNKADTSILDELAKKANDKLSALEEEIRIFVDLP